MNEQLRSAGEPLDHATRSLMEARLGHDFSQVRVHADSGAAESNRLLDAEAYTVGNHIAFAQGSFNPSSEEGRKLLAHELTHVVQQGNHVSSSTNMKVGNPAHAAEREATSVAEGIGSTGAMQMPHAQISAPVVQRSKGKKAKKPKRMDVALVFDDHDSLMAEADARADEVIRAFDVGDAKAKLTELVDARGLAIGTLHVISHADATGEIMIMSEKKEGEPQTASWVPITTLSLDLKDVFHSDEPNRSEMAPLTVDFRGCQTGEATDEMDQVLEHLGSTEATGTNCFTFTTHSTPLTLDGIPITKREQVPKNMKKAFDQAHRDQLAELTTDDGQPVGHCLLGSSPGKPPTLKQIKDAYFANEGRLVASWVSETLDRNWQPTSMCTKDMKTDTSSPCRTVKRTAPKK